MYKPYTFAIATANAQKPKLQKNMSLPKLSVERKIKYENTTTYIKNSDLSTSSNVNI